MGLPMEALLLEEVLLFVEKSAIVGSDDELHRYLILTRKAADKKECHHECDSSR
jgi:hypothetical protein